MFANIGDAMNARRDVKGPTITYEFQSVPSNYEIQAQLGILNHNDPSQINMSIPDDRELVFLPTNQIKAAYHSKEGHMTRYDQTAEKFVAFLKPKDA